MAEATGEAHTVAVDMGVLQDCVSQQSSISSPTSEHGKKEIAAFRREALNPNWVSSINGKIPLEPKKIKSSSASESCSIHRVPSWLRRKNSDAYDPKVISIGPLHYEKREGELRAMEEHKWRYLHDIVSRKQEDEGWLKDCLAAVKGLEERARNCYSEVIPLDSDSFVEMMVLDACFILELFRREWNHHDDVIFELDWLKLATDYDLSLMENQIPFFILQRLSVLIDSSDSSPPLVESALNFFFSNYSTVSILDIEVSEDSFSWRTPISSPTTFEDDREEIVSFRREDLNRDWISSIEGKILLEPEIIKSSSASESCSIHRVPSWLRRKNSDAYDPKVISIGPLHYEKRKGELRAAEEHKWKYLQAIVSRKHEGWLEDCLAAVKGLEERARNCYSEVIPLDSDSFVEMMVLDGCFILELFRRDFNKDWDVILTHLL
ncbi:UPF0481-like protein [Cinnamomum micranthum f. kanehirae]|uniref:UPF0481-like protein n=1 Tax=Cinnamomum micranthum f. kanehirae TaxID=337451 RepID=A0A3S3QZ42_9MAGN|nr:UPF0481-like protein [Cinnamomum micranthum f. kanehirae]